MKHLKTIIYSITLVSAFLISSGINLSAQQYNTMYHLDLIPQSNQINPAFQGDCGFYLGMPGAAPHMQFSSGLTFGDFFYNHQNTNPRFDSTVLFLYNRDYQDMFLNRMDEMENLFETEFALNYLSLGFQVNKFFFSLDHNIKMDGVFNISSDLPRFILRGNANENWDPISYDFSNTDVQMRAYHELGIGVSYQYDEKWTFGIRPKIYHGLANISMYDQNIRLNSTDSTTGIVSDFGISTSVPTAYIDESDTTLSFDDDVSSSDIINTILGNSGLGIDLGATYQYDDKITLSASIIDLGYIKWDNRSFEVNYSTDYTYEGTDITGMIEGDDTTDVTFMDELSDSLETALDQNPQSSPFRTNMYGKLYLGASYQLYPWLKFGVLSRTQVKNSSLRQQLTLSTNLKAWKLASFALSYTMMNNTYNNLGIGFSLKPGPLNFYLVADKAFYGLDKIESGDDAPLDFPVSSVPHSLKNISFRFGFNLMFGCKEPNQPEEPILE